MRVLVLLATCELYSSLNFRVHANAMPSQIFRVPPDSPTQLGASTLWPKTCAQRKEREDGNA